MTVLTSETTFEIQAALETAEATVDLVLLPENAGIMALRELHYFNGSLPPLIYEDFPDTTENFDTGPLTTRPLLKVDLNLAATGLTQWPGYVQDQPIKEIWKGENKSSRMSAYFLRRLWELFANQNPDEGFISWWPKDRTAQGYNILIESLGAGTQGSISLDTIPLRQGYVLGEIVLAFRIIGETS
jgi:hypothetical protein